MKRQFSKTELTGILAIIFGIGILIDIIAHRFEPVALVFSIGMIIFGRNLRKKGKKVQSNILLVGGFFILIINLFSSAAFQLLFVSILFYIGYQLWLSKQEPTTVQIETKESEGTKPVICSQPFLKNMFIGNHRIMNHIYQLDDINIWYGVGDVHIDFTMAMIPEGETVIIIHGLIGNVRLYVPYDIEVSVNHSVLVGNISMLGHEEKGFNKNVILRTEQYADSSRRIKIISSLLIGDMEVRYA
ncbi:cell wall-active antibiotics response protein LiaF [Microbacteriaceae bacterium 4G12]